MILVHCNTLGTDASSSVTFYGHSSRWSCCCLVVKYNNIGTVNPQYKDTST